MLQLRHRHRDVPGGLQVLLQQFAIGFTIAKEYHLGLFLLHLVLIILVRCRDVAT